jgi:hypothetical protein
MATRTTTKKAATKGAASKASSKVSELATLIAKQPAGTELGVVSKSDLAKATGSKKRVKAVLFIPEDSSVDADLQIDVVGIRKATLSAMVARRC